jgi:hypothetical protein
VKEEGDYKITLCAQNALGKAERTVILEIHPGNVLVTPLLGFTSWNAFGAAVTQADMESIAKSLVELGITEYGYSYVNLDSGWQEKYGGKYDAVMPNAKFPNMGHMTDTIHALGLKCGIYSAPMLRCYGIGRNLPGCKSASPVPNAVLLPDTGSASNTGSAYGNGSAAVPLPPPSEAPSPRGRVLWQHYDDPGEGIMAVLR